MRMKVPKMPVRDYLDLVRGLRTDPRFHLSNQDLVGGFVRFRSEARLRLLTEILDFHNYGITPPSTIKKNADMSNKMKDLGFNREAWIASLEGVRGPDSNDFFQARCPSCARSGGDTGKDHLVYTLEGVVHCFKGCNFFSIIQGYYKEDEA